MGFGGAFREGCGLAFGRALGGLQLRFEFCDPGLQARDGGFLLVNELNEFRSR
jgi:hypothetical protein